MSARSAAPQLSEHIQYQSMHAPIRLSALLCLRPDCLPVEVGEHTAGFAND
jgi:hypothetical protein